MTTKKDTTIADVIRALRDEDEISPDSHLSIERLLSYHRGTAAADEAERIEAHFARCRSCTERSMELAQFLEPEEELDESPAAAENPRELTPAETEAVLRRLLRSLPKEASTRRPTRGRPATVRRRQRTKVLQAVAATLLVAAVLAPVVVWQSAQRRLARFLEAEPNVPIVSLEAAAFRREAGQPAPPPAVVPPGALLILLPEREPGKTDHTVEILGAAGERIDTKTGLRPTDLGQFHLRLPRNLSPGATYRIRILYPQQNHAEEFPVVVAESATR